MIGPVLWIFAAVVLIFLLTRGSKEFFTPTSSGKTPVPKTGCSRQDLPSEPNYRGVDSRKNQVGNFQITNHLPSHHLRVTVSEKVPRSGRLAEPVEVERKKDYPSGSALYYEEVEIASKIEPLRSSALRREHVVRYLTPGNMLHFYVSEKGDPTRGRGYVTPNRNSDRKYEKLFAHYILQDHTGVCNPETSQLSACGLFPKTSESGKRIKALHVGMITTRTIGGSSDVLHQAHTSGNAVGGASKIKIHNLSEMSLCLNVGTDEETHIPSHGIKIYKGYLNQGVPLGTILTDADGLYPPFQYLEPHSDVYFGVVSDIQQPLSGCFQHEYNDRCDFGQTLWPFEEGVL